MDKPIVCSQLTEMPSGHPKVDEWQQSGNGSTSDVFTTISSRCRHILEWLGAHLQEVTVAFDISARFIPGSKNIVAYQPSF